MIIQRLGIFWYWRDWVYFDWLILQKLNIFWYCKDWIYFDWLILQWLDIYIILQRLDIFWLIDIAEVLYILILQRLDIFWLIAIAKAGIPLQVGDKSAAACQKQPLPSSPTLKSINNIWRKKDQLTILVKQNKHLHDY